MSSHVVSFVGSGWVSGPVVVADSFWKRFKGLIGRPDHGLLLRGCSVHGLGMRHALEVVGLTDALEVIGVRHLKPMRVVTIRGATWLLELPSGTHTPEMESTIALG